MNKFDMEEYLEDNLDRILKHHFQILDDFINDKSCDLENLSKNVDDIVFYKEWSKDKKYKVSVFLIEGEEEKEGEEISD